MNNLKALALSLAAFVFAVSANAKTVDEAKAALMEALKTYTPGAPITAEITASISDAAAALEEAAGGPPNLLETPDIVNGQWTNLFSSQGVVGEIDTAFMTRTLPGGGEKGGKATSLAVLQELRPAERFYRNTMVMTAGENDTPLLYIATADLGVSETKPNDLEVRFKRIVFAPARADVTLADLRGALNLPAGTPLAIDVPVNLDRPASTSTVTYIDEDLRINRGKDYIAILRKVH